MGHRSFRNSVWMGVLLLCLMPSDGRGSSTPQTIFFSPLRTSTHALRALATSGLPVRFQSTTRGVCEALAVYGPVYGFGGIGWAPPRLSGWTLSIVGLGTCSIIAIQDGDDTYSAA